MEKIKSRVLTRLIVVFSLVSMFAISGCGTQTSNKNGDTGASSTQNTSHITPKTQDGLRGLENKVNFHVIRPDVKSGWSVMSAVITHDPGNEKVNQLSFFLHNNLNHQTFNVIEMGGSIHLGDGTNIKKVNIDHYEIREITNKHGALISAQFMVDGTTVQVMEIGQNSQINSQESILSAIKLFLPQNH
ncbi:hypothetical protein ACOJUR_00795 [Alicyclobacillus tolerans]|uniref:hypothetical protein n=1 Tax=Alicyclobacillus tolerans TaxID=90970 RepID=UPI003B7E9A04